MREVTLEPGQIWHDGDRRIEILEVLNLQVLARFPDGDFWVMKSRFAYYKFVGSNRLLAAA